MRRIRMKPKKSLFDARKLYRRRNNAFTKGVFIQMTPELYELVKERTKERNTTLRLWITRAVIYSLKNEFKSQ